MNYTKTNKNQHFLVGWSVWLLAAIFYALDYFQHTAPSVLIKPIAESSGLTVEGVGTILSVYFPIYALSQVPAGYLLDKYGSKLVLSISCFLVSLGLLVSIQDSALWLLAGRVLVAIGSATAFLGALKVADEHLSSHYFSIAVGLTNTIGVLGGMFGQIMLNRMIEQVSWQNAFWIIGLAGIVLSVVLLVFIPRKGDYLRSQATNNISIHDFYILKNPQLWLIALYAGIMVGTTVNAFSELYDVIFLQHSYGLTAQQAATVSTTIFIGIACGGPSHGIIADWFTSRKTWMLIANVICILVFAAIVLLPKFLPAWTLFPLYFLLGFSVSSMLLGFVVAKDMFPENIHGTVMAVINMTIGLSAAFFQPLIGEVFYVLNGDLKEINNPYTFEIGFLVLLVPLIASFFLCYGIRYTQADKA